MFQLNMGKHLTAALAAQGTHPTLLHSVAHHGTPQHSMESLPVSAAQHSTAQHSAVQQTRLTFRCFIRQQNAVPQLRLGDHAIHNVDKFAAAFEAACQHQGGHGRLVQSIGQLSCAVGWVDVDLRRSAATVVVFRVCLHTCTPRAVQAGGNSRGLAWLQARLGRQARRSDRSCCCACRDPAAVPAVPAVPALLTRMAPTLEVAYCRAESGSRHTNYLRA